MLNINDKLLDKLDEKEYWLVCHLAKRINRSGGCWPSMETILKDTGWKDERTVRKYYRSIESKGVMSVNPRFAQSGKQLSNEYIITSGLIGVYVDLSTMQQGVHEMQGGRGTSDAPQSINQKDIYVELDSTVVENDDKEKIPYDEIIAYLNEQTGKNFRHTTKATQRHIRARWNEGYRLEDFEKVISCKVLAWGLNPRMKEYLRPETLFGTKFESYLNACNTQPEVNAVLDLTDIKLTEAQGVAYLDYHQHIKENYPNLYQNVTMLRASEYFAVRPHGRRWDSLNLRYSFREVKRMINEVHKEIETGLAQGRTYPDVYSMLNNKLEPAKTRSYA